MSAVLLTKAASQKDEMEFSHFTLPLNHALSFLHIIYAANCRNDHRCRQHFYTCDRSCSRTPMNRMDPRSRTLDYSVFNYGSFLHSSIPVRFLLSDASVFQKQNDLRKKQCTSNTNPTHKPSTSALVEVLEVTSEWLAVLKNIAAPGEPQPPRPTDNEPRSLRSNATFRRTVQDIVRIIERSKLMTDNAEVDRLRGVPRALSLCNIREQLSAIVATAKRALIDFVEAHKLELARMVAWKRSSLAARLQKLEAGKKMNRVVAFAGALHLAGEGMREEFTEAREALRKAQREVEAAGNIVSERARTAQQQVIVCREIALKHSSVLRHQLERLLNDGILLCDPGDISFQRLRKADSALFFKVIWQKKSIRIEGKAETTMRTVWMHSSVEVHTVLLGEECHYRQMETDLAALRSQMDLTPTPSQRLQTDSSLPSDVCTFVQRRSDPTTMESVFLLHRLPHIQGWDGNFVLPLGLDFDMLDTVPIPDSLFQSGTSPSLSEERHNPLMDDCEIPVAGLNSSPVWFLLHPFGMGYCAKVAFCYAFNVKRLRQVWDWKPHVDRSCR